MFILFAKKNAPRFGRRTFERNKEPYKNSPLLLG
jgi:hypothetical protein